MFFDNFLEHPFVNVSDEPSCLLIVIDNLHIDDFVSDIWAYTHLSV